MNALINANLRDALLEDLRELQALNQKALPHVNSLTYEDMLWFLDKSAYFRVIGDIKGFLIALKPGLQYDSNNYRWFSSRYDSFFYIDRIIISEDFRRQGLGSQLYKDVIKAASSCSPRITCEVNSKPANPNSMSFHKTHGFTSVGTLQTEGREKEVRLFSLDVYPPD